jgi:hypothetical protein
VNESYTHWSQVLSFSPNNYSPRTASRIAEAIGLEAFQYSGNGQWYALDDDGHITIAITTKLAMSLHNFKIA